MGRFLNYIRQLKPYKNWKIFRQKLNDHYQNRELVGEDRFGNRYYQYYSFFGLPTRRQIKFKNQIDLVIQDLVYYQWLHNQVYDPPTQQQKQQFYLQQKIRFEKALQWDRKDQLIMIQFRKKRQQLLLRDLAVKQIQQQMKQQQLITDIGTKRQDHKDNNYMENKEENKNIEGNKKDA